MKTCPFLGLVHDKENHLDVPSDDHRCFVLGTPETTLNSWQAQFCLGDPSQCPRRRLSRTDRLAEWAERTGVEEKAGRAADAFSQRASRFFGLIRQAVGRVPTPWWPRLGIGVAVIALVALSWQPMGAQVARMVATKTPTVTATPTATSTSTRTRTWTPSATATETWTATATATSTATHTATNTPTETWTVTATATATPTATPTPTITPFNPPADSPPDRVVIPGIDVDVKIETIRWEHYIDHKGRDVTGWHVPDWAAGWHYGSAYPGTLGNCVISGHNNFRGEVFRYLYEVTPGDEFFLYVGRQRYHYLVTDAFMVPENEESEDVRRENAQWIGPTLDERATLVSCWPYLQPTYRVIVIGKPIP